MKNKIIDIIDEWLDTQTLKLRAGEMTVDEVLTVKAVLKAIRRQVSATKDF